MIGNDISRNVDLLAIDEIIAQADAWNGIEFGVDDEDDTPQNVSHGSSN